MFVKDYIKVVEEIRENNTDSLTLPLFAFKMTSG